jgi:predicted ATPase
MILTPDQRLRVFVSSTLGELAEERKAVQRAIESLQLTPVMFEQGASPHPPQSLYRAYLEQSHVFVAIYWQRYGWVGPDMDVSGLEDEYRLSEGMPRLVYVKRPAPEIEPGLKAMLDRIRDDGVLSYKSFGEAAELENLVSQDLVTLLSERFQRPKKRVETRLRGPVPAPASPLVGRDEELAALTELLLDEGTRLVTLTGPGGVGKTRLAIETGNGLAEHFPGGIFFVPLASVEEPEFVPASMVRALGLSTGGAASPGSGAGGLEAVRDFLRDRQALLILDNFEQLASAAALVLDLLRASASLKVVVTSRAVLRVQGEHEFPVGPLSLPAGDGEVGHYDAIRLFVDRARAVRPDFDLDDQNPRAVAEICRRLDGLPLAIELVAARVKLLPPDQLLARLGDRLELVGGDRPDLPERQQTMRNTIAWSHDLLNPGEKRLFARLGVFAGGFTLDSAEAVCGSPADDLLEALSSLIDKSLVQSNDRGHAPGFGMLRTVRSYALERLESSGEAEEIRGNHARYFVGRALDAYDGLRGPEEAVRHEELLANTDNLRAAYAWWVENADPETLAGVGWSLWMFWWLSGSYHREGRQLMEQVLARGEALSPRGAARALAVRGLIAFWQADYGGAVPDLRAATERFEQVGDEQGIGYTLTALSLIDVLSSGGASGEDELRDGRRRLASIGDRWGAVLAMNGLLWGLQTTGQLADSDDEYCAALAEAEALGSPHEIGMAHANLGRYHVYRGEPGEALPHLQDWLEQLVRLGQRGTLPSAFEAIAEAAMLLGDPERAVQLLAAAAALRGEIGAPPRATARERTEENLRRLEAELGENDFRAAWSQGAKMPLDEAVAAARPMAPSRS